MAPLSAPILSAYDPLTSAEGSIDPLGLASAYERLADAILPGITVRMRRPRFLTAIAIGAYVCSDLSPETLAKDGVSPPWQVFEWWFVEAHARSTDLLPVRGGIPGIQKAQTAVRNKRPLSAAAYLRVPSVFGYTGIYRRLARQTRVLTTQGMLDDAGYRLLAAWMADQKLDGFLHGEGPGKEFARRLFRAVRDGLASGHTEYRPKSFWDEIVTYLNPFQSGSRERAVLRGIIAEGAGNPEELSFLIQTLQERGGPLEFAQEADFLRKSTRKAPIRLRGLFTAIDAYESFCRHFTDLFDLIRHLASISPIQGIALAECEADQRAEALTTKLRKALAGAEADPLLGEYWPDRGNVLTLLKEGHTATRMVEAVLEHHENAQQRKPPDGKRPWLERGTHGRVLVRAGYRLEHESNPAAPYVHEYRMPTLSRFLEDLGAFA
ncbi:MAG TPA: hypothetical protein VMI06_12280 [Terriglobia bacterium]|nr:hypothetical protein [Terriglobia bacterium]